MSTRPRNPIQAQLEAMLDLIQQNQDALRDDPDLMRHWTGFAEILNSIPDGCVKPARAWYKTWTDLVTNARQALTLILDGQRLTPLCQNHIRAIDLAGYRSLGASTNRPSENSCSSSNGQMEERRCRAGAVSSRPAVPPKISRTSGSSASAARPFSFSCGASTSTFESGLMAPRHSNGTSARSTTNSPSQLPLGFNSRPANITDYLISPTPALSNGNSTASSTSSTNVNDNSAQERSSRLVRLLEERARALFDNFVSRFERSFEEQTRMLQESFQEQNRILLDNLPIIIRQEVAVILERLPEVLRELLPSQENHRPAAEQVDGEAAGGPSVAENPLPQENPDQDEELEDLCIVCQDRYRNPKSLNCSHTFCNRCIRCWLKENLNCPICRQQVNYIRRYELTNNIVNESDTEDSS